jgi:hypothetical protein
MNVLGQFVGAILLFWPAFCVAVELKQNINLKGMLPAWETSTHGSYDHASKMK